MNNGVKYAILLGAFIGLFNMIPYFGAIIAVFLIVQFLLFKEDKSKIRKMCNDYGKERISY